MRLETVRKSYAAGTRVELEVLHGVDLSLKRGEFAALIGPSGSGKSTLLNLIGLLDRPTAGEVWIEGERTSRLDDNALTRMRGRAIGFVFQYHNLLPEFTALENVMMPLLATRGRPDAEMRERARALLDDVALAPWSEHKANDLSGGQQQRVAVARALAMTPALMLADEPTGNLDSKTSGEIMALFDRLHRAGHTIVVVTHERDIAEHAQRIITIRDGVVASDEPRTASAP